MAITQTLDKSTFVRMFDEWNRSENFSYEARELLFDYYEEFDNFEMDVIGICCDWTEFHWTDIAREYNISLDDCEDDEEKIEAIRDYLQDNTTVLELSDGETFVFSSF